MMSLFWIAVALFVALQAYVRLAPSDPRNWTIADPSEAPGVYATAGGYKVVEDIARDPSDLRAAFEAAMLAQPRTRKLAEIEGQHIYITRSLLWGFPDYTTLAFSNDQTRATFFSRLRFGQSDMGVNKKRLQHILSGIGIGG